MRLHKVKYFPKDSEGAEQLQEFFASGDEASKRCTAIKAEHGKESEPKREQIEVPTDKAGLIEWLNANAGAA